MKEARGWQKYTYTILTADLKHEIANLQVNDANFSKNTLQQNELECIYKSQIPFKGFCIYMHAHILYAYTGFTLKKPKVLSKSNLQSTFSVDFQ